MSMCYDCNVAAPERCWTCSNRNETTIRAMNNWLEYLTTGIVRGYAGIRHDSLSSTHNCPCGAFNESWSNRIHTAYHNAWEHLGHTTAARRALVAPPRDVLLAAAGFPAFVAATPSVVTVTPLSRSERTRRAISENVLGVFADSSRRNSRSNGALSCTNPGTCPICILQSAQTYFVNGNNQASTTSSTGSQTSRPNPINTTRLGWGVELETYLPARFIADFDYNDDDYDDRDDDDYYNGGYDEHGTGRPSSDLSVIIERGSYHHGRRITAYGAPDGWRAESDGSLATSKRNYVPIEIVSPVLTGATGLGSVRQMSEFLAPLMPHQNHRSGMHCHVGVLDADAYKLYHLRHLFAQLELAFYASCGNLASRRMLSEYCRPASYWLQRSPGYERYSTLNLCNNAFYIQNTYRDDAGHIEIRIWPGTTRYETISMAVHMGVALVGAAHELWTVPEDAALDDIDTTVRLMCDLIERYPVATRANAEAAIEHLQRRAHRCDLNAPAIRTYAVEKERVMP